MNEHIKSIASKVVNSTANVISAPARAIQGARGAVSDFKRDTSKVMSNFRKRKDNTNLHRSRAYWRDHTN